MGCDYYTQSCIVVCYLDENNVQKKEAISETRPEAHWIYDNPEEDSDDDDDTKGKKWTIYKKNTIQDCHNKKMLYENDAWVKDTYKTKYHDEIVKALPNDIKILNVYKKTYAYERE
jgi:hypothetical protein